MSLTSFLEAPERDLCKPTKDFNGLQGTMLLLARNSILHFEGFTGRPLPPGSTNYIMGVKGGAPSARSFQYMAVPILHTAISKAADLPADGIAFLFVWAKIQRVWAKLDATCAALVQGTRIRLQNRMTPTKQFQNCQIPSGRVGRPLLFWP